MNLRSRVVPLVLVYASVMIALANIPSTDIYARAEAESAPAFVTVETIPAEVSAYTSSVEETDDDPMITANGETVARGTIACPSRFKFGTIIQIEKRIYVCNDRMNKRYRDTNHFDIWFESRSDALTFGRQKLTVHVLSSAIHSLSVKTD